MVDPATEESIAMVKDVLKDTEQHMEATIGSVTHDFNTLRTGRASISILDDIMVDYYGNPTPLNQLAGLSAPDPNLLVVQPYDKSVIDNVEKAIHQSELGLNPGNDGTVIRIPIPELTEERRLELTKVVGRVAEQGKTAVRNLRRDANDRIKKLQAGKEISEDEEHRAFKQVQELTDQYCKRIDEIAERKNQEILEF
jgi:ribosome recycling factor